MVDARPTPIPRQVRDAAADWVERGQRTPGPAFERALKSWLASDSNHHLAYDEALRNWQSSAELGQTRTGRERQLVRAPFLMRRNTHIAAVGVASITMVFVALGSANLWSPIAVVSEASAQTLITAKGEIRTVTLTDGSRVTLDTETIVQVSFTPKERRASLSRGRARFAVAADSARPFVVEADGREIRGAHATFDISVNLTAPFVTALAGRVEVLPEQSKAGTGDTVLAGNEIDASTAPSIRKSDPQTGKWVSGMLVFDATPLSDAVTSLNRYNRATVRIADPELERLTVSGAFRVSDPAGFVRSIATMYHLHVTRRADGTLTLTRVVRGSHPEK
jgi:transmembrane sensor